jgi:hypothetical protein
MFVCCVPRSSAEFLRVFSLEQSLFGRFSVPPEIAKNFFSIRPEIYQAVIGPGDTLAAYSSVYPLKPHWATAFIAGEIGEPELEPHMLLERDQSLEEATLYIGSVVVADRYDAVIKSLLIASMTAWRAKQFDVATLKRFSVIGTPLTEHGHRLRRRGGAALLAAGSSRKDGCSVYGREITHGYHSRLLPAVERLLNGSVVEMKYNFPWHDKRPQRSPAAAETAAEVSLPALS